MTHPNEALAIANFSDLRSNSYPGRGIGVGLDETGRCQVQIYWIMGRSENSRNRVFRYDSQSGRLYTEAADPAKMRNPALVIYNAMRRKGLQHVVSNGDQTDIVIDVPGSLDLSLALAKCQYEPDSPNFTPRITAVTTCGGKLSRSIQMSILRKSLFGDECDCVTYQYTPYPGFGYCLTTYSGDGSPLPSFRGDPLIIPIRGDLERVAETYWDALNVDNRVSLAVKFIEHGTNQARAHVINKYRKVGEVE